MVNKNISNLPKWAQEHIRVLEMRLREAREEKYQWFDGVSGVRVFLPRFHHSDADPMGESQPLRDHQRICFITEAGEVEVGIDRHSDVIQIIGETAISVLPESSNVVKVKIERR